MTTIPKSNQRIERNQISDALTSIETDVTALQASVATLEAGVNGKVPTSLKGIPATLPATLLDPAELAWITETTASLTTFDTWTTVLEETAAEGIIEYMLVYQVANASNLDTQARLSIDGTVVWTSSTTFWDASGDNNYGVSLVGSYAGPGGTARPSLGAVPFTTSFKLEFKKTENAAGTVEMGTRCKYYLTG